MPTLSPTLRQSVLKLELDYSLMRDEERFQATFSFITQFESLLFLHIVTTGTIPVSDHVAILHKLIHLTPHCPSLERLSFKSSIYDLSHAEITLNPCAIDLPASEDTPSS